MEVGLLVWNLTKKLLFLSIKERLERDSSHLNFKLVLNILGKNIYIHQSSHSDTLPLAGDSLCMVGGTLGSQYSPWFGGHSEYASVRTGWVFVGSFPCKRA